MLGCKRFSASIFIYDFCNVAWKIYGMNFFTDWIFSVLVRKVNIENVYDT